MSVRGKVRASIPALLYSGLLTVSFAAMMWGTRAWPDTPDGLFHLHRVRALAEALRAGVLYPRWFPDFAFGHGYPVLHYYAPAFYYPPALLRLAGVDLVLATRVTVALVYALSGAAMLLLLRRWASWGASLFGSIIYLVYPYRLYDLFVRGALPEFAAFLWLPLVVLGACATTTAMIGAGASVRPGHVARTYATLLLVFSFTGLVVTHNLTAMMAVIAGATGWLAVLAASGMRGRLRTAAFRQSGWRGAAWVAFALMTAALLSAPYALPALLDAHWVMIGNSSAGSGYANHFATWQSLWAWAGIYPYPSAADLIVPAPAYALAAMTAAIIVLPRSGALRVHLTAACVGTLIALWLMTGSSEPIWRAFPATLGRLQFPWRWHTILAFSVAGLAALTAESLRPKLGGRFPGRAVYWGVICAISAYVVVYALAGLPVSRMLFDSEDLTSEQMWAFDAQHGQVGATWTSEFLPRWVAAPVWAIGRELDEQEAAAFRGNSVGVVYLTARVEEQGYLSARYTVVSPAPVTIALQSFYFPAWRARVDGVGVPTSPATSLGLLSLTVPSGEHRVEVDWGPTFAVWLGRAAFVAGWLAVFWLFWSGYMAHRRKLMASWVAVAGLLLAAAGGSAAREISPFNVQADFGAVQLLGASAGSTAPGQAAIVRLHWIVPVQAETLTAFVHVVDEEGRVLAQNDAPLGGVYFPASRWTPGLIFHQDHRIGIPPELEPGRYRLLAGLYRTGEADAPLVAAGRDEPRVDAGVVEVRR